MTDIFKEATRLNLTFDTSRGKLNVQDLWQIPLTMLDTTAREVNRQLKALSEESFINRKPSSESTKLTLQLEIIKAIIESKEEENARKLDSIKRAKEKEQLLSILATKEQEDLFSLSIEEIKARLTELSS